MALGVGEWTPPARIQGDQRRVDSLVGRPIIVVVRDVLENHSSRAYPEPKDKVIVDLVDLAGPTDDFTQPRIYVNCLWGAGAVVDGLKEYKGDGKAYMVKPGSTKSANGRDYIILEPLAGDERAFAMNWLSRNPEAIDAARAEKVREAQAQIQGHAAQAPQAPVAPQVPSLSGAGVGLAPSVQGIAAPAVASPGLQNWAQQAQNAPAAPPASVAPGEAPPFAGGPVQSAPAASAPSLSEQAAAALAQVNAS